MFKDNIKKMRSVISCSIEKCFRVVIDRLPTKTALVLECESDMDDNPRAFYEYLLRRGWNKKHKIIWVVNDVDYCEKKYAEKNVIFINRNGGKLKKRIQMYYYFTTARYFVFSHPYWFKKRRSEQVVVNICHGTATKDKSVKDDPNLEKCFDWCIVTTEFTKPWMVRFGYPNRKLVACGYPRSDELFHGNKMEIMSRLFKYNSQDKIIICMPTYKQSTQRQDGNVEDKFSLDVIKNEEEFLKLNEYLKQHNVHLIIKPHPLQLTETLWLRNESNIHYINNRLLLEKHIIFYQLLGCCDGLLSDLSSVIYDFYLVDRPIGLLTRNYDHYIRGFITDNIMDYFVGTEVRNYDELISFIEMCITGDDGLADKRAEINKLVNKLPAGHDCEDFYHWLFETRK